MEAKENGSIDQECLQSRDRTRHQNAGKISFPATSLSCCPPPYLRLSHHRVVTEKFCASGGTFASEGVLISNHSNVPALAQNFVRAAQLRDSLKYQSPVNTDDDWKVSMAHDLLWISITVWKPKVDIMAARRSRFSSVSGAGMLFGAEKEKNLSMEKTNDCTTKDSRHGCPRYFWLYVGFPT